MKRKSILLSSFAACLISLLAAVPALAFPPLPSSFYGTVKVYGSNVPDGTLVRALINGQSFSEGRTQTYRGDSVYSLDVPGDDPSTTAIEGGHEGDTVQVEVGGVLASQTGTWHTGTNVRLDVNVSAPAAPIWTPVPTVPVAAPTSTPTAQPAPAPTQTPIPTRQSLPATAPLPTQGPITTGQPVQPVLPSPTPSQAPAQPPSSTPAQARPSGQSSSPTPTGVVVSRGQASPAPVQGAQQAATDTGQPTAVSRLVPTSTTAAVPKQSLPTAAAPAYSEKADADSVRLGGLLLLAAVLVVAVGAAAIGTVIWSARRVK